MLGTFVEWMTMIGEWAIAGTIIYEGSVAMREYRSARLFDAIKYIEDQDTRKARKMLYEKLEQSIPASNWWEHDPQLADAAATVCAMYNLLGAVTKEDREIRTFVVREWANNILWTHEALGEYMRYREQSKTGRPGMFRHYEALYREAQG